MKYFYTAGHYYDCPTCDNHASEPEDIFVSPVFESVADLIRHISSMIPSYYFYTIFATGEYGVLVPVVPDITNNNSFHNVVNVKFELEGNAYTFNSLGLVTIEKIEVKDEQTT